MFLLCPLPARNQLQTWPSPSTSSTVACSHYATHLTRHIFTSPVTAFHLNNLICVLLYIFFLALITAGSTLNYACINLSCHLTGPIYLKHPENHEDHGCYLRHLKISCHCSSSCRFFSQKSSLDAVHNSPPGFLAVQ